MTENYFFGNYLEYPRCIKVAVGQEIDLDFNNNPHPIGPPANEIWYTSSDGNIVTPHDTSSLPEIDTNVYSDGKGIIKFKTDATSIGEIAFANCTSLTSVTIPDSVTSIGDQAFYGCTGLTSASIGNSVESIGTHAFANCGSLTSVTIPDSVESIGDYAFYYCSGLKSVTIPDNVTSIGEHAFLCGTSGYYSGSLETITVGENVFTYNGEQSFEIALGNGTIIYLSMYEFGGGSAGNVPIDL